MPDPRKDSYTRCEDCSKEAGGDEVVYHFTALTLREPFWGGEAFWTCPKGHKVDPPPVRAKPAPPAPASS